MIGEKKSNIIVEVISKNARFLLPFIFLHACSIVAPTPTPISPLQEISNPPPTPPSTLPELIAVLSSPNAEARIGAARVLGNMGSQAAEAIPGLITNLYYTGHPDVRQAAADALGEIGPSSRMAIPALINIMLTDSEHVRRAAAVALGNIGSKTAIPALANILYEDSLFLSILAAESIEKITGIDFDPDGSGHSLNENEVPNMVASAIIWWETVGSSQLWLDD